MESAVQTAHEFLKKALHPHAVVIDATLGQGKDSQFFLDQNVHEIHAFEILPEAALQAEKLLNSKKVSIHLTGHENMERVLEGRQGMIDGVIFNFGYFPLDASSTATKQETSLSAVMQAVRLLKKKGRMALVFYPHPEGIKEQNALCLWLETMQDSLDMLEVRPPFRNNSPWVMLIVKKTF